jgi:tetratricopeptide (TPR) repeat protein
MLSGRYAEALWDAGQAIAFDPTLGASFELRAQARLRTGDPKGAVEDADQAIAMTPHGDELFKSYVTRGLAFAMLNDGPGAVADLDYAIAIELNPREPALLLNRGQIRIQFGDVRGGCADLRQAASRGRDDAKPLVAQFCAGA